MSRPFEIQGPDENGDVWICSPEGVAEAWCHNVGPVWRAAQVFEDWLREVEVERPAVPLDDA